MLKKGEKLFNNPSNYASDSSQTRVLNLTDCKYYALSLVYYW